MKNKIYVLCFLALMSLSFTGYAQVYKTVEDTIRLNKEYTEVSNDIAQLTAKLAVAQNNLPRYKTKAGSAETDARDAAVTSSEQADKAVDGGVKEARKAKREAKKAYRQSKDVRSANSDISDQNDKIASLTGQLARKQERLQQLTEMRTAIEALSSKP